MADVVLAILAQADRAAAVLDAAERLAMLLGEARLTALPIGGSMPVAALAAAGTLGAVPVDLCVTWDPERIAAITAAFEAWTDAAPGRVGTRLIPASDDPGTVEEATRRADWIVAATPRSSDDGSTRHAFRAALLHSERSVLALPSAAASFGTCVAVAWRDDPCARRAVLQATRVLHKAEKVVLLSGVRGDGPAPAFPAALTEHGIAATQERLQIASGAFGAVLLERAHAAGADMLVLGAYAHSPLREFLLGGVTRWMLEHADLPLLMRH